MQLTRYCFLLLLVLLFNCSPKNEEVTEEHIDTDLSGDAVDSAANTRRDIVERPGTEEADPMALPQPVLQLLERHYTGWKQPTLLEGVAKNARRQNQGPYHVRGDFNGDNEQDFAVQIQQGDHVVVIAFVHNAGNWEVQELKKDILFNERGRLKSLYYLYLTEAGAKLASDETNQDFETQHDAVTVGINDDATTYVLENGRFRGYSTNR